ncbi:hypothetical protein IR083_21095 [Dysgonomonas sp. GY75]|uniref:hypothetical protein n=1 Tax=Dysgonomonas sp. GY75 TaxID=2780419 RepID=UPI0018833815|nr:hypothetical protein [Dysgonomonas sp. GY75]MBF0651318.1 hypothetical protein [Dysgonomonas sp. GY75]
MKEEITVLSLFDGMSGGQIALKQLGIPVAKYYASEIDKFASDTQIYKMCGNGWTIDVIVWILSFMKK